MKRICMTGFDPVRSLGDEKNPSYELIRDSRGNSWDMK